MPDLETSLSYCTFCPKLCRHTCPVSNAEPREILIPQAKMAKLRQLRTGESPATVEDSAPLYGCTGCGACTEFCMHKVEPASALFAGRAEAERAGHGHPALAGFVGRFEQHSRATAEKTRAQVAPERRPPEAQVAFMPGCDDQGSASAMLALCERLQASYVGIADGNHGCGGYPLLAAGQPDAFRMHAERVASQLSGYTRVIVQCPACAWAMKTQYRAFGVPLRPLIEHTVEFLSAFSERLPITRRAPPAFYHDPCYLGRYQQLYDAPRRLAEQAVSSLHEFSRARGDAECSGGGALLPITMPAVADEIASRRLREVKEAKMEIVVTACATCKRRLTRDGVTAVGLVELLEQATR